MVSKINGHVNGHLNCQTSAKPTDQFHASVDAQINQNLDEDKMESIAIIGFSLTFPESATSAESFWSMLMDKRCVSTPWPKNRLNGSALYHPDPDRLDSVRTFQ